MVRKIISNLVNTEEKKRLLSNIFSLGILQGANYILPLLTVPYLVRVLGPDYFGLLAFSSATVAYYSLITEYGFNLSATKQISINRDNKEKINEIFSSVMMVRILLLVISLILINLQVVIFDKFRQDWIVYLVSFGTVLGQALFPIWLFQGLEKMKYITFLNLSSRVFFTISIFIFIQEKEDYIIVPLLTSLGSIIVGVFSLVIAIKTLKIDWSFPSINMIKFQLVDGWHIFMSRIAISLYTISITIILGIFTNNTVVGYFSAADKIIQAVKGIYFPISQAIYPLISNKINENKVTGLIFVKKITLIVGFGMFVISLLVFLNAEEIIQITLGDKYHSSIVLLEIMAFLPFIISLSNMFGVQTMLNLGYKKAFSYILFIAAILGVLLSVVFAPKYEGVGTAVVMLIIETLVTISMMIYLKIKLRN